MSANLRIVNGRVYDPANGIDGEVREICIAGGKIVARAPAGARRIDAQGMDYSKLTPLLVEALKDLMDDE